jgi:hypothetical protein
MGREWELSYRLGEKSGFTGYLPEGTEATADPAASREEDGKDGAKAGHKFGVSVLFCDLL